MGATRLAIYLVGLVIVVLAAWVFLTQTPIGKSVPATVAIAIILLLVGVGVMASARSVNDSRYTRRVTSDTMGAPATRVYDTRGPAYGDRTVVEREVAPPASGETVYEERRFD